jgi:hypothetical protein
VLHFSACGPALVAWVRLPTVEHPTFSPRDAQSQHRYLVLECIGIVNFLAFFVIGMFIGGSALLGQSVGGLYFVGDHGRLTQVTHSVYVYSWIHTLSQLLTFPLFVFGAGRRVFDRLVS